MKIKTKEFDKKFDEGGDIFKYLDISKARRSNKEQEKRKGKRPEKSASQRIK